MTAFPKYDSYKDTEVEWIGEIPEHWSVTRNLGLFDERKEVNRPDMELLSVTIDRGVIKQEEITTKKDSSNEDKSKYKVVRIGDLAYNKMRMWQGAIGMSEYDGIVSPAYIILNTRDKAYARYFHYLYRTEMFINEANRHSYGLCSDMNSLRYEDFKTIYSPVPPKNDVEHIVNFLDQKSAEIDTAIAKKQRLIELLKEQKAILINQAVTKGLNPNTPMRDSGVEWIGEMPEHWGKPIKLTHACSLLVDGTHHSPQSFPEGQFRYITAKNIKEEGFDFSEISFLDAKSHKEIYKRCPAQKGDVLYIKDGATAGVAMVNSLDDEFSLLSSVALIRPRSDWMTAGFLKNYLNSLTIKSYIQTQIVGGAMTRLTLELIGRFKIVCPPIDEQERIVAHCEEIIHNANTIVALETLAIERLYEIKQIFIANAVTGKAKI